MSTFSFGAVFGNDGIWHGDQTLKCPCGNTTDWLQMTSDANGIKALCGECGRHVTTETKS
ncbi:hypothetical protein ACFY3B_19380 [Micromonospora parva]|uniref:Uncharacterized protein n=1 Tax=Micromonospora parva TaxID=1464048 RepID=A0ABW6VXB4_9ACTN